MNPPKLYTLYLLLKILFAVVFPRLLSYLSSYTPPSSSFQTSLSPCSHLVLYPSPPLLCSVAFTETHPLTPFGYEYCSKPRQSCNVCMCVKFPMLLALWWHIPMGLYSAFWLNIAWLCLHTSLQDCDKWAEHSEQMPERCWHPFSCLPLTSI